MLWVVVNVYKVWHRPLNSEIGMATLHSDGWGSPIWIWQILHFSMAGKSQFHCRAVCNSQKMPVRLFNSIFFSCYSLSLLFDSSYEIEKSFIMLYHQGNDPSTGCRFLWGTSRRICHGSGRTTETARNHHKGLCIKNGQTLMGCIRRPRNLASFSPRKAGPLSMGMEVYLIWS